MRMNLDHVASGHFVLAWAWERRSLRVLLIRILPVDSRAAHYATHARIFFAHVLPSSAEG